MNLLTLGFALLSCCLQIVYVVFMPSRIPVVLSTPLPDTSDPCGTCPFSYSKYKECQCEGSDPYLLRGTWNIGPNSGESIGICLRYLYRTVNSKGSNPLKAQQGLKRKLSHAHCLFWPQQLDVCVKGRGRHGCPSFLSNTCFLLGILGWSKSYLLSTGRLQASLSFLACH